MRFSAFSTAPRRPTVAGLVSIAAVMTLLVPLPVASADDHLVPPDGLTKADSLEAGPLVAGLLQELGLDAHRVATLVGQVQSGVSERVGAMLEQGAVTIEGVEHLEASLTDGSFLDQVPTLVEASRARRDAFRIAAVAALAHLGVEEPDGSIHEALRANGLYPSELERVLAELGLEMPPPPGPRPHHPLAIEPLPEPEKEEPDPLPEPETKPSDVEVAADEPKPLGVDDGAPR